MCVCFCVGPEDSTGSPRTRVAVGCEKVMWVLGMELWFIRGIIHALNC